MKLLNYLFELGANKSADSDSIKRLILVNKIAIVFCLSAIPFMVSIFFANLIALSLFVPIIIVFLFLTLYLNNLGKFTLAKLNLFMTILLSVYFYAGILGPYSGIQYVYLSLIGFGFSIFDSKEKKFQIILSLLPILCFLSLYFSNFSFFYTVNLTQSELTPIYLTSIILIFLIIWLTIVFFDQSNELYKKNLKDVLLTYQLSEREGEVFLHILNGQTNKSISQTLFIEEGTVKNHLTNIYKKLKVKSRNELMAKFTG